MHIYPTTNNQIQPNQPNSTVILQNQRKIVTILAIIVAIVCYYLSERNTLDDCQMKNMQYLTCT